MGTDVVPTSSQRHSSTYDYDFVEEVCQPCNTNMGFSTWQIPSKTKLYIYKCNNN